ncbi:MAG TPA: hypothetical protein VFJ74_04815 [Gemmatimonadaceae bacterium]|nr:hypothetical protein [Gemmatimonadaceae bacterium]
MPTGRGGMGTTVAAAPLLLLATTAAAAPEAAAQAVLHRSTTIAVAAPASSTAGAARASTTIAVADAPPIDDALRIGFRAGALFPSDGKIRDVFGDVIPAIGLASVSPVHPNHARFFPMLDIFGTRAGKNHFFVVPLTMGVEYQLPAAEGRTHDVPFVRAEAGVAYFDYRINHGGTLVRSRRGGGAASLEAGLLVSRSFRFGARYRLLQRFDGYDFGGVELYTVIGSFHLF